MSIEKEIMFDAETLAFLQRLHRHWHENAQIIAYEEMRDDILNRFEGLDIRMASMYAVTRIVNGRTGRSSDTRWARFFSIAQSLAATDRKLVKRSGPVRIRNSNARARNLAIVTALWSPQVVLYYGWQEASHGHMHSIRACAIRFPHFETDFCGRLNVQLLRRHCEAIEFGRSKNLNEASLQIHRDFDLKRLESDGVDCNAIELWTTSTDGSVPINSHGVRLNEVRPQHYSLYLLERDQYGMLVGKATKQSQETMASQQLANDEAVPKQNPFSVDVAYSRDCGVEAGILSSRDRHSSLPMAQTCFMDDIQSRQSATIFPADESCSLVTGFSGEMMSREEVNQFDLEIEVPTPESVFTPAGEHFVGSMDWSRMQSHPSSPWTSEPMTAELESGSRSATAVSDFESGWEDSVSFSDEARASSRSTGHAFPIEQCCRPRAIRVSDMPANVHTILEEELHDRNIIHIREYIEAVSRECAMSATGDLQVARVRWLTSSTRWAGIWTSPRSRLLPGAVTDQQDAEVLYYTSDEFIMDSQKGQRLRQPIVIKEDFADTGMHTVDGFAQLAFDVSSKTKIEMQSLNSKLPNNVGAVEFLRIVQSVRPDYRGNYALKSRNLTRSHRPLFTMIPRFRLLETLVNRLKHGDVTDNIDYNILELVGSSSGPHVEAFCGKWIRNLEGVRLFTFVPENEMKAEWPSFALMGADWTPAGKERLIVLEQDDVLLLPPGLRIVHAVHSPKRCLMEGGMIWDDLSVMETLHAVLWACENQAATSEPIVRKLPLVIDELLEMIKEQPDRFRGHMQRDAFVSGVNRMIEALGRIGCDCGEWCHTSCLCSTQGKYCTLWCKDHTGLQDRGCKDHMSAF